jgi:predicted nucleotidyltransferase
MKLDNRLTTATLSEAERNTLRRFVASMSDALGDDLRGLWLYGSRARGEAPREDSDVESVHVFDPEWLKGRRKIESFFIQEVDRDKVILAGSALE